MRVGKRLLPVLMSIVLAAGLMPLPAFAEGGLRAANMAGPLSTATAVGPQAAYDNDPASILDGTDAEGAYAVLYDDGELLIQRGNENKRNAEDAADGPGVTAVYTGLETGLSKFDFNDGCPTVTQKGFKAYTKTGAANRLWTSDDYARVNDWTVQRQGEYEEITSVRVLDPVKPKSLAGWFMECHNLVSADLAKMNTSKVTDMGWAFEFCTSIERLDLSGFDTRNVTTMYEMFWGCSELKELDLSSFKTPKLEMMVGMFYDCESLKYLDLSGFDTNHLVGVWGDGYDGSYEWQPFDGCNKLEQVEVGAGYEGNIDFPQREDKYIFGADWLWYSAEGTAYSGDSIPKGAGTYYARSPMLNYDKSSELDGSNRDNVYAILYGDGTLLFQRGNELNANFSDEAVFKYVGCNGDTFGANFYPSPLWTLDSYGDFIERVVFAVDMKPDSMEGWFDGWEYLRTVDFGNIDTGNVTSMRELFYQCKRLSYVDMSYLDTSSVADMSKMFSGCEKLKSINTEVLDCSSVEYFSGMFESSPVAASLNFTKFDTSSAVDMKGMFRRSPVVTLDLSGLDASRVEDMTSMFLGCTSLRSIDFTGFKTRALMSTIGMFGDCFSLRSVDLSSFDMSHVKYFEPPTAENMPESFYDYLESLDDYLDGGGGMFGGCASLEEVNMQGVDTSSVVDMSMLFTDCVSLQSVNFSELDTSNVTDMSCMFQGCKSLESVDLSSFDTSKVENMAGMFWQCSSLRTLDLSNFDTSRVKNIAGMFEGCAALESLNLSDFATSKINSYQYETGQHAVSTESISMLADGIDAHKGDVGASPRISVASTRDAVLDDVFKNCPKLKKVTVGKGFAFKHKTLRLPAQSSKKVAGADGKWYTAAGAGYAPAAVPSNKAATYYAVGPLSAATVSNVWNKAYTGKALTQSPVVKVGSVTLKKGKDYELTYSGNVKVGTAMMTIAGIGNRVGAKRVTFKIVPADKSLAKAKVSGMKQKTYTGKAQTQKLTVKLGSKTLKSGADYKVTYEGNVSAGTAKAVVHGVGAYGGSKAAKFTIAKAANPMSVAARTTTVNYSKKAQAVKAASAYKFAKKAAGAVTYSRIAKGSSKWLPKVDPKTGAVTVKAGAPKGGTYSVNVKVAAKGNANYKSAAKTVTVKVKMK